MLTSQQTSILLWAIFFQTTRAIADPTTPSPSTSWFEDEASVGSWMDQYLSSPTSWTVPPTFTDMAPFHVTAFAAGATNLAILRGSPAEATSTMSDPEQQQAFDTFTTHWNDSANCMQILYPKGSNAPSNKPQGGTEFYPHPLDLTLASNVSLQYSIFFSEDFDYVKGGKLPGLYGGHKGCSGGNSAVDCFSTRMMWRAGGDGELYLYVPKDKQTPELCSLPPKSVCNSDYGLSIGRGAWKFPKGRWTTIRQDIWLNTPGINDGGFNIWINDLLLVSYDKVRYRENAETCGVADQAAPISPTESPYESSGTSSGVPTWQTDSAIQADSTSAEGPPNSASPALKRGTSPQIRQWESPWPAGYWQEVPTSVASTTTATDTTSLPTLYPQDVSGVNGGIPPPANDCSIGFIGLFFSTFFGGHTPDWSPSQDQYTYFKDFSMRINA